VATQEYVDSQVSSAITAFQKSVGSSGSSDQSSASTSVAANRSTSAIKTDPSASKKSKPSSASAASTVSTKSFRSYKARVSSMVKEQAENIEMNSLRIAENSQLIQANTMSILSNTSLIQETRNELYGGLAMSAALSTPELFREKGLNVTAGSGYYGGRAALSFSANYVTDRVMYSIGYAHAHGAEKMARAGVSFHFGGQRR
jgi:YadA-like C-terminal region.